MDDLKHRAGEKLEAFHVAAVTAAGNGKSRVQDVYNNTSEGIQKIKDIFNELWHHELVAEGRARAALWAREAARRVREGAPPLSPLQLYEELKTMFNDRVWRRSVIIFACGVVVGGGCGLALGLRAASTAARGPHARALHSQPDQSVILVDDAVTAGAGAGEVLVRVQAFSACECDRRVLRGRGQTLRTLLHHNHLTLGRGFAGVVLDVGAGVGDLELGDEVWGCLSEWSGGAAAELITIRRRGVGRGGRGGGPGAGGRGVGLSQRVERGGRRGTHHHQEVYYIQSSSSGVVLDVGAGVGDLELGDEVWGCLSEWSGGAAAELITIRSTRVSKRPSLVSCDGAASLAWSGGDALLALHRLRYTPDNCKGKRVAICGAASGSGCVLIQLLSGWGAHLTVCAPRHAANTLQQLGAEEYVDISTNKDGLPSEWAALETAAKLRGPWDAVITCTAACLPAAAYCNTSALLKATAPRAASLDLRPRALVTDRLPAPAHLPFALFFYTYRVLRWIVGCGSHTDWLEERYKTREGLCILAQLVDSGHLKPTVDKIYFPQDFENALAHACSEDAIGTTVVRFP